MILYGNGASLTVDNRLAQRQSDSIAYRARIFPTIEPVKQTEQIFLFKAWPAVMQSDLGKQRIILAHNFNLPVVTCTFHAVFKDILDCL